MAIAEDSSKIPSSGYEFFNQQWKTYQKILNNNYMGHREIYQVLQEFFLSYSPKPLTILELGCGDAFFTAQALANINVASYQGIDLSNSALEIATSNMARIPCSQTFTEGDFSLLVPQLAQNPQQKFDVILISFALHHLNQEQKDYVIGNLYRLLNPKGVVILIDIFRKPEEDRETYLRRYLQTVQNSWDLLTPEEYSIVENHMLSSDFPETQSILDAIAQKHDFHRCQQLYCDRLDTAQMLCFYR
ncbi:class I SAM-dependent methyltransferase [Calothrix sp. 336/3]|uniref:class I SAM-dependent methyltransferase n=1 Tax=Calothrix sp. 336/3 TaxID=1337936 RepID=UPI0006249B14|nr:class I SAM-dependent methyltransferase [Calothrix sp. 336/3]AKG20635.1 ubiquinone biosynthesis protein UbiE [Calothrix sp. 336/3]